MSHGYRFLGFLALSMLFSLPAQACKPVAELIAMEGQVSLQPAGKVVRVVPKSLPKPLCAGDTLITFQGVARLRQGRMTTTLDHHSSLTIQAQGNRLDNGQALFDVRPQAKAQGVEITTRLSVIGVKGTRFLVSDREGSVRIAMDEGDVDVRSTKGPIGLYRESASPVKLDANAGIKAEYERYQAERQAGVEAAAKAYEHHALTVEREFVAYVESMNLAARRELTTQLTTTGAIAVERDMSQDTIRDLERLHRWH